MIFFSLPSINNNFILNTILLAKTDYDLHEIKNYDFLVISAILNYIVHHRPPYS